MCVPTNKALCVFGVSDEVFRHVAFGVVTNALQSHSFTLQAPMSSKEVFKATYISLALLSLSQIYEVQFFLCCLV